MAHARIRTNYDLGPEGVILIVTTEADPAAGAEVSVTVPGRAVWELISFRSTLVTDATVTGREPHLILGDGETTFIEVDNAFTVSASTTRRLHWFQGSDTNSGFDMDQAPMPDHVLLLPGWTVGTITPNLQAGDNYGAPVLYVREVPQRGLAVGQDALLSALRRLIDREV